MDRELPPSGVSQGAWADWRGAPLSSAVCGDPPFQKGVPASLVFSGPPRNTLPIPHWPFVYEMVAIQFRVMMPEL